MEINVFSPPLNGLYSGIQKKNQLKKREVLCSKISLVEISHRFLHNYGFLQTDILSDDCIQ